MQSFCVSGCEYLPHFSNFEDRNLTAAIPINLLLFSLRNTNQVLILSQCASIKLQATEILLQNHEGRPAFKTILAWQHRCASSIFAIMSALPAAIAVINKADYYHRLAFAALYLDSIKRHFDGCSKVQVPLFLQMVAWTRVLFPPRIAFKSFSS